MTQTSFKPFSALAALLLAAALGPCPAARADSDDAVTYRTNAVHTAQTNMPDLIQPIKRLWSRTFPQRVSYPLIADGMVYVATYGTYDDTSHPSVLYGLDQVTGKIMWGPTALPLETVAGIAYDNKRIFVTGIGPGSGSGEEIPTEMLGYSAAHGKLLWSSPLRGQWDYSAAPTPYGGYVYTQGFGNVSCVRENDGGVVWSTSQYDTDGGALPCSPAGIFLPGGPGNSYSLDPATGLALWMNYTGYSGGGGLTGAYFDNKIFLQDYYNQSDPNGSAALDGATGDMIQSFPAIGPPAFDNHLAIGVSSGAVTAMRTTDFSTAWTLTDNTNKPVTAPTIVNDIAYVGTSTGYLFGYNESTGAKTVSLHIGQVPSATSESYTDMAAGDGLICIPAGDELFCVGDTPTTP